MAEAIGLIFSILSGIFLGKYMLNWFEEMREEVKREENERVEADLKRQMDAIQKYRHLQREVEVKRLELERLKEKQRDVFLKDPLTMVVPYTDHTGSHPPEDGIMIMYKGKVMTYKKDEGWVGI